MKKNYLYVFSLFVALLLTSAQNAFADAVSDASAWYNWSTFKIQVTYTPTGASAPTTRDAVGVNWDKNSNPPGTPGIDFFWYGTPTTANADAKNNFQTATDSQGPVWDWSADYQSTAQVTNALGLANVINSGATVSARGQALSDGIITTSAEASSAIHRSANIFSNIDALFTFSVDSYASHLITKNNAAESAWAQSNINFFITVNDNYTNLLDSDFHQPNNTDSVNFYQSYHQQVEYFIPAIVGDIPDSIYRYTIGGSAHSAVSTSAPQSTPVPEPATMLLIGSGLVGLAGLRRKFKK